MPGQPPVAAERLTRSPDGRLRYELKRAWRDGTTHVGFEPLELIEKLAALVPPPRFNLVRYHGVLAPAARDRARVVPSSKSPEPAPVDVEPCRSEETKVGPRPRNYGWAELMRRVFEVDALECPECQGPMRALAAIHSPEAIRAILDCVGLPSRAPPIAPAAPGLGIDCEDD